MSENETPHREVILDGGSTGRTKVTVDVGTSMLVFDIEVLRQQAIADFVGKQLSDYKAHSSVAVNEDVALAIGYFGVPLSMIYNEKVTELALDDALLGAIVKWRMAKEQEEKN